MRDYGKVFSTFWSSATTAGMTDDGKLLALYLMTCSHSTIAGVFRLPDGYVSEDLVWPIERVQQSFSELLSKGFANRCETTKWVWIVKHLEWNPPENPNQRKSATKIALSIPRETCWIDEFMRACGVALTLAPLPPLNPSVTLGKGLRNQEQKQEQKQEQEQEQEQEQDHPPGGASKSPRPSRKCPSAFLVESELQRWAREEVPSVDIRAETAKFRDHTFKNAISDWDGAWRNWMRRAVDGAPRKTGSATHMDTAARNAEAARLLGFDTPLEENHAAG
jgi:hypothetical protein